jgi:hypothetical protein
LTVQDPAIEICHVQGHLNVEMIRTMVVTIPGELTPGLPPALRGAIGGLEFPTTQDWATDNSILIIWGALLGVKSQLPTS